MIDSPTSSPLYCTRSHRGLLPLALRAKFRGLDQFVRELAASASTRLVIVAPYLSPAGMLGLKGAVASSAQLGAWIRLVTGGLDDADGMNRRAIAELIEGEVGALIRRRLRILTDSASLPILLHAKFGLVDRTNGYLGSANRSWSAMEKNFELGVALGTAQVAPLEDLITFLEAQGHLEEHPELLAP